MATNRRQQIQLTPDEQAALFRERKKAALATIDKDGYPHVVAMNYFARDGAFYMTSYGKAQKVLNVRRNPNVALMVEAGDEYSELRGVMIRGRCEILEGEAAVRAAFDGAHQVYWTGQTELLILAAQAWVAQAQGHRPEAHKLMRAAADLEDGSAKHALLENRLYPMRELLADLLREQGDPGAALTEYDAALKTTPNRLRSYYGAARAAEAIGERKKAAAYFAQLAKLTQEADGNRPELIELKAKTP